MKKQFRNKEEFDKWIAENFQQTIEEMLLHNITDEEIIQKLLEHGYTDLNDLVADGHGYQIGEYTNNGWLYEDEADMSYINATGRKTEIRKR